MMVTSTTMKRTSTTDMRLVAQALRCTAVSASASPGVPLLFSWSGCSDGNVCSRHRTAGLGAAMLCPIRYRMRVGLVQYPLQPPSNCGLPGYWVQQWHVRSDIACGLVWYPLQPPSNYGPGYWVQQWHVNVRRSDTLF